VYIVCSEKDAGFLTKLGRDVADSFYLDLERDNSRRSRRGDPEDEGQRDRNR
jgi:hypothetical protein